MTVGFFAWGKMQTTLSSRFNQQQVRAAALIFGVIGLTWILAGWIVSRGTTDLVLGGLGVVACAIVVSILNDWRSGFHLFLVWLLFEDLARKYMGNNMLIYFGKDALVGVTYLSFFLAFRRGRVELFRPPFMLSLSLFFWLGVAQMFNPNSPSLLYGLLGLKLYFYYFPLIFVGYGLLRNETDVRRFLWLNVSLGVLIALLGIVQAIRGLDFLNPQVLAPELETLGRLTRMSPVTGQVLVAPPSVFVSAGRFAWYLILAWIMTMGALCYLLLRRGSRSLFAILGLGVITGAAMLSGVRTSVVFIGGSALVMSAGFLWGAPWKWGQVHRLTKAIARGFGVAGISLLFLFEFFPKTIGAHWSFYSETLSSEGPGSELEWRALGYPIKNLTAPFQSEDWPYGNGMGTSSLGVQYLSRLLGERPPPIGVESGFGTLVVELGILGPILWIVLALSLLRSSWRVLRQIKQSPLFPLGFSIFWFCFLVLFPFMYMSMSTYQNYVYNAYFWLLLGVLFRLPALTTSPGEFVAVAPTLRTAPGPSSSRATS